MSDIPVIAIVDDDDEVRLATCSLVRSIGFVARTYACAEDFLLARESVEPSCLITDIQMPGMSGVELQQSLIATGRSIPTLFLTAYPSEMLRERVLAAGACGFLKKPCDGDTIVQSLQEIIDRPKNSPQLKQCQMTPIRGLESKNDISHVLEQMPTNKGRSRIENTRENLSSQISIAADGHSGEAILRRTFGSEDGGSVARSLARGAEARSVRHWIPMQIAATVVLTLCIGSAVGWWARGSDVPTGMAALSRQAAMAQRVFAPDATRPIEISGADERGLVIWAAEHLGRSIKVPDLSRTGFRLLGGRLVATEGGPACLFMYEDDRGERVSVFVRSMQGSDIPFPMRAIQARDVTGFAWMHGGLAFSVVSSKPLSTLQDLSNHVQIETNSKV